MSGGLTTQYQANNFNFASIRKRLTSNHRQRVVLALAPVDRNIRDHFMEGRPRSLSEEEAGLNSELSKRRRVGFAARKGLNRHLITEVDPFPCQHVSNVPCYFSAVDLCI